MKYRISIIVLMSALTMACGSKSSDSSAPAADPVSYGTSPGAPVVTVPPPGSPWTPPGTGVGSGPGSTFTYGGTTGFVFDSTAVYNQYVYGIRSINNLSQLSNVKINLNFDKFVTSSRTSYGGTVTIAYTLDGTQSVAGYFTSGNDARSTKYNVWFSPGVGQVWHGFFEDFMGAIVVVIDGTTSMDDGVSSQDFVSGSVWFKNYAQTWEPHPDTYCWFIVGGAYDCRAWKDGWGVNTTAGIYPNAGYTRLGTFTNMPVTSAFNQIGL